MKNIVVSIKRDRYCQPKLTIVVEARVSSESAARKFVTEQIMAFFEKRRGKHRNWMRVKDFRIVDEVGLKRLQAAAKASVTLRRKRAAKKAAATRAKNKARLAARIVPPALYYPATSDYAVN